jgi:predicted DNA-binding transcriptional regulator
MEIFSLTFSESFMAMFVRLAICLLVNWIIVDRLYYRKSHRRDFYFTFMLISLAIFLLIFFMIFVLEDLKAKTSIGIGIGLFGIFSIMRYRTDSMPVREMTYLFVIVALSVVNAIASSVSLLEILATNAILILAIWLCEVYLKQDPTKLIQYDRIELILPERRAELIADLQARLGIKIDKVEVGSIDFLRDMAILKVHYKGDFTDPQVEQKMKLNAADFSAVNDDA